MLSRDAGANYCARTRSVVRGKQRVDENVGVEHDCSHVKTIAYMQSSAQTITVRLQGGCIQRIAILSASLGVQEPAGRVALVDPRVTDGILRGAGSVWTTCRER